MVKRSKPKPPFGRGVNTFLGTDFGRPDTEVMTALRMLQEKYPGRRIDLITHTMGDFIELRSQDMRCRIDRTFLASAHPLEIAQRIEHLLRLKETPEHVPPRPPHPYYFDEAGHWDRDTLKQLLDDLPKGKIVTHTNSPTEQWAEDWAKRNEKGKGSV